SLMNVETKTINTLAQNATQRYSIASRCGVFAKSDVQPLLNQGAAKSDIALSILHSVANQTVAGLAQGRPIEGQVVYLGGPLTFIGALRSVFDEVLGLQGTCPEHSLFYVALGAALAPAKETHCLAALLKQLQELTIAKAFTAIAPLFVDEGAYAEFATRHESERLPTADPHTYQQEVFLGVDAGSTTVKAALIGSEGELLYSDYQLNNGNAVQIVHEVIGSIYRKFPHLQITKACSTGYGELLIKHAFDFEYSIVETIAHYKSANAFLPGVDFIIDIGGQDIKCFQIANGVVEDIFLNEACSSGCGSFLQTFSNALGYSVEEAATLALRSQNPVDLGSRCTVFMNSSVKQAQKDGATIEDIFAGLAISVVKNALYKVVRTVDPSSLGEKIVVQGGTFLNDAVLRAFEVELGKEVVRPQEAGLMGAYGCALHAKEEHQRAPKATTLLDKKRLSSFTYKSRTLRCKGCTNHCLLTINTFSEERKFISGNQCDRIVDPSAFIKEPERLNLYAFKQQYLASFKPQPGRRGKIGLPMQLSFYEQLPFWHTFFTKLGFEVITSPPSDWDLYLAGQSTIPSDTVCYPAKLMHGHIDYLLEQAVPTIFYPCATYNIDERKGDNHFNCPVVAYYPEVLKHNIAALGDGSLTFISDYLSLGNKRFLVKRLWRILRKHYRIPLAKVRWAARQSWKALEEYQAAVRAQGKLIIAEARAQRWPIILLAGRPYHVDNEVNHGIDTLLLQCEAAVITEDAVAHLVKKEERTVLNQWTYHARMYDAARWVSEEDDVHLVQLISFGCGLDAVTSDEVRDILHAKGKIYTQIKIDEIANLGAVKIRIRSLLSAIEQEREL
ncbi:MAG TPA: acyl-CoA dehydratase activase-related protein, partial [Sphaerochaeta sp.]|nr:acyl-CoA dehydratase activase-related protein [Sphaerochaeta sp.]